MHKHITHYFSLIGVLVATFVGFIFFSYDKSFQLAVITAGCVGYFTWGIVHHYLHRNLSLEVIFEYAVVASLGFVIGISVIYRS